MTKQTAIFAIIVTLFFKLPSYAQEADNDIPPPIAETDVPPEQARWFDGFFLQGAFNLPFIPGGFSDLIDPKGGFRGGLGYEYKNFHLAFETGYTHIIGTNPLVLDVKIVPISFKFGYNYIFAYGLGLQADALGGFFIANAVHYETAIDLLIDNLTESKGRATFLGARLYATYTIPNKMLKIYAGGGGDFIFEKDGTIPMPVFEAGVAIKPFVLIRRDRARKPKAKIENKTADIVFSSVDENIVVEETSQGRIVRLLNAVYFEADSSVMIESFRPILDEAGERLRANPSLSITLRGYTAPFGTAEGRAEISRARAHYCGYYLAANYGVSADRMIIESYGAQRAPEFRDAGLESFRCVELIIE